MLKNAFNPPLHISAYLELDPVAAKAVLKYTKLRPSLANMQPGTSVGPFHEFPQVNPSSLAAFLHVDSVWILPPDEHFPPSDNLVNDAVTKFYLHGQVSVFFRMHNI